MIVYTVEIYDISEYNNCLVELQVFPTKKEAEKYVKHEIKKYKSYQDDYTSVYLTEWYGGEDKNYVIWCKNGIQIMQELIEH